MLTSFVALLLTLSHPSAPADAAIVGSPAPAFELLDERGDRRTLEEFRGRFVVLEWHSDECPYVAKHYRSENMQKLQREWTSKGIVWLTMESAGVGRPGYMSAEQAQAWRRKVGAASSAVLLDPDGKVGRLYSVRTALHMFVVNPQGVLIYNGAIDNRRTANVADVAGATNYVDQALTEATTGRAVSVPTNPPYGCTIHYTPPSR